MNKGNEQIMAILVALRKLPRWALILLTLGVIIVLGVAMFLLIPQSDKTMGDSPSTNPANLAFSVFLKMGVVVILLIGLAIILRRWQTKGHVDQSKQINILETVHLTPHRSLYYVNINGQKLLLGATDQSITTLCQINSTNDFSEVLANTQSSENQIKNE